MYWDITFEHRRDDAAAPGPRLPTAGRFVVHRHTDAWGPHLDLRVECGGQLLGWRIDAEALEGAAAAVEKGPHSLAWLEEQRAAEVVDNGRFAWLERGPRVKRLRLFGAAGTTDVAAARVNGPSPQAARLAAERAGGNGAELAALVEDGVEARRRAFSRLCGLGRELDGENFSEDFWRSALQGARLVDIQDQLASFERRFDAKHPPVPASRPEPLPDLDEEDRRGAAMRIAGAG